MLEDALRNVLVHIGHQICLFLENKYDLYVNKSTYFLGLALKELFPS